MLIALWVSETGGGVIQKCSIYSNIYTFLSFTITDFAFYLLNVDEVGKSVQAYQEALTVSLKVVSIRQLLEISRIIFGLASKYLLL